MDVGLRDRVVLVTGGSSGIGRAAARAFAAEGAQVAVTYREHRENAEAEGFAVPMDLERPETIQGAVDAVVEHFGRLDVLVVSAVRWPQAVAERLEELPADEWRALLRSNLEGAFEAVRTALPPMRAAGWGRIVLISSGIGEEGVPTIWGYAGAKAGLVGLARSVAWDAGRDGILINVVGTGFTRTDRNREHFGDEIFERVGTMIPQRRVSEAEDVARLIVFLGSGANTSITGEVVREGTSNARTPLGVMAE
jgi:NAD(P)-dependent dehydrogenase (short-subunit alcohol dehydrogenase family)